MNVEYTYIPTPLGPTMVAWRGEALTSIRFGVLLERRAASPRWHRVAGADNGVTRQLLEYFAGDRRAFDLEVEQPGTGFQRRVWAELASIPCGETRSYGDLAATLGSGARAVGSANARNDVPIVVPCHRVVAADGSLHGYAGGLGVKAALLAFERSGRWPSTLAL